MTPFLPKPKAADLFICLIFLLLSMAIHQGRMGASVNGLDLTTDTANYATMAAAQAHPAAFAKDPAYSDPDRYGVHTTTFTPLISRLGGADNNFGLAYLKLTGVHVFVHYLSFYLLGLVLLKKRWQALLFTLLMGQVYWTLWGTYWGGGHADYTPRLTFTALYPFYIMGALALLHRPRWWPPFLAATGLLIYIHSISTLPVAFGFWLGFALHRPEGWTWRKHVLWLIFSGCCFLAAIAPFMLKYLRPGISLSGADVDLFHLVLTTRYNIETSQYWQGLRDFFFRYVFQLPIFPLALGASYAIWRHGNEEEKNLLGQFAAWSVAVLCMATLYVLDHEMAKALHRVPYQFDLIRVMRFLMFFSICLTFMGINVLLRVIPRHKAWAWRTAAFLWFGFFTALFLGGQHESGRMALGWYWNSLNQERYEQAYAPLLQRDAMIEAVKKHTEPGASIFDRSEDRALRYRAQRAVIYTFRDASIYYYSKDAAGLRRWEQMRTALESSPTAYLALAAKSDADYVLSNRPEDKAELEKLGPVVWENATYVLVRLKPQPAPATAPAS